MVVMGINVWMVLLMVISSWVVGGLWYSKFLFGKAWCDANGSKQMNGRHCGVVFGTAFVLWAITATAFASALGPYAPFGFAVMVGVMTGLCFVATSFGVNYVFSGKSLKCFLIDGGYSVIQFALYGVIVGYWNMASMS